MKTDIYYFTGSGNSSYAAGLVAKRLGNCQIIPIVKALGGPATVTGERVIVVFPVYMFRAPHIVCKFLKKISKATKVYAIATMGGASGKTFGQIRSILRKNGLDLYGGYTVIMPDNYTPFNGAIEESEQNDIFKDAVGKIDLIVRKIQNGDRTIENDTPFYQIYFWPGFWYWLGYISIPKLSKEFHVRETCNGCGICLKVCPRNIISLHRNKPQWKAGCEHCLACLQWCPQEAIEFGNKTLGKKRYKNPYVSLQEIIAQKN